MLLIGHDAREMCFIQSAEGLPRSGSERHQYEGISALIARCRREISAVFSGYLGKRLFVLKKIPYFRAISVRNLAGESGRLFRLLLHEKGVCSCRLYGKRINQLIISLFQFGF